MKCAGKVTRTNGCQELWYIRHLSALIAKHAGHERPREVRSKVYDLDTMHCATVERAELVHDDEMMVCGACHLSVGALCGRLF